MFDLLGSFDACLWFRAQDLYCNVDFYFQDQFVFVNSHTTKFSTGILIAHFSFRFFSKGCVYGCNNDKERFAFFCHAALEFLLQGGFHPVSE